MADEKHILLIEDDRETASTLIGVLEREGYHVRHAPNGVEGQRLLQAGVPHLVITDMMMPKMGGFPVLEFIKSLDVKPKVIMITANEGGRHKAYAEMLGVVDYLRKPFAMDVMLDAVRRAFAPPSNEDSETEAAPKKKAGPIKRSSAKAKKKAE